MAADQSQLRLPVDFAGPPPTCAFCNYDLRGLPAESRCPECGQPFARFLNRTPYTVSKPETPLRAVASLACVRCGADLSGRSSDGGCPACAAPIWLSLDGDWLCVRHPRWLRSVRRASVLWFWALLLTVVWRVASTIVLWTWNPLFRWARLSPALFVNVYLAASVTLDLLTSLLLWSAAVLLTLANPAQAATEPRWTARRLIRSLTILDIALRAASFGRWAAVGSTATPWLPLSLAVIGADGALYLAMIAYARQLAGRLPDQALVRWLRLIFWGFVAVTAVNAFANLTLSPQGSWNSSWLYYAFRLARPLLSMSFTLWLAIAVHRLHRALRSIVSPE